jgi:hypothetical protein
MNRMTKKEMDSKYPNRWLGITNPEYDSFTGKLIAADVLFTDKTASELASMSMRGEDVEPIFTTPDRCFHAGAVM